MFSRPVVRMCAVAGLAAVAQVAAAQEQAQPARFHSIVGGATQLSNNGTSSTGVSAGYFFADGRMFMNADLAAYSQSGVSSQSSLVALGLAFGPFRNPEAIAKNPQMAHVAFGPAFGLYSSYSDAGSDTNLWGGAVLTSPLFGRVASRVTLGFIMADGATVMYNKIGLGFSWR